MPAKKLKVHFIGIGGIGVSALAQYYLAKGHQVSGSDLISSEIIRALKKKGVKIYIGKHQKRNLPKNADLVIYSPAVQKSNPELTKKAKSYPEALGELTKEYFTIAVSGTHGKSTTCAMIGLILTKARLDPTVIVGTKVKEFGNANCRVGKSNYLVIEADEHFSSFLNYWPKIIVLTNIEKDHLDYYKNLRNIRRAYKKFIAHLPEDGILITEKSGSLKDAKRLKKILKVPGQHNVADALLALAAARALKIPDKISYKALSGYQGSWRRFEIRTLRFAPEHLISSKLRKIGQLTVVSDYGHHPTEIKATLKAAREKWPKKKIWCVFQPHQHQRTFYLFKDFVKTLSVSPADKVIITDIYDVAGRETKEMRQKVNSEKLVKAINSPKVMYLPKSKVIDYLKNNLEGREILIIMGAGDIYELDKDFK